MSNWAFRNKILLAVFLGALHLGICLSLARVHLDMVHDGVALKPTIDIAENAMVHRDTLVQYGPLPHILPSLVVRVFGKRLLTIRFYTSIVYCIVTVCLFVILTTFMPQWLAFFTTLMWILVSPHAWVGVEFNPAHDCLLLEMISLIFVIRYFKTRRKVFVFLSGVASGVAWGVLQPMGTLCFLALFSFLAVEPILFGRSGKEIKEKGLGKETLLRIFLLVFGFASVLLVVLTWLSVNGALSDWYAQTIQFPKLFYISRKWGLLGDWYVGLVNRASHQWFWPMFGIATVLTAFRSVKEKNKITFLLSVFGLFSWLNGTSSPCDTHLWWGMTINMGLFVWLIWEFNCSYTKVVRNVTTVLIVLFIFFFYGFKNATVAWNSLKLQNYVIEKPEVLAGMKTEESTATWLKALDSVLSEFRKKFPETKLITLGDINSPLLLCLLDKNRNFHPLYTEWPVLSHEVYPDYFSKRDAYIKNNHPLILTSKVLNLNGYFPVGRYGPYILIVPEKMLVSCRIVMPITEGDFLSSKELEQLVMERSAEVESVKFRSLRLGVNGGLSYHNITDNSQERSRSIKVPSKIIIGLTAPIQVRGVLIRVKGTHEASRFEGPKEIGLIGIGSKGEITDYASYELGLISLSGEGDLYAFQTDINADASWYYFIWCTKAIKPVKRIEIDIRSKYGDQGFTNIEEIVILRNG